MNGKLIDLGRSFESPFTRKAYSLFGGLVENALGISAINNCYDGYNAVAEHVSDEFFGDILRLLKVRYVLSDEDREKIPTEGSVLVVANHPFGGIDGLIMASALLAIRPDFKMLVNYLLAIVPEARPYLFTVDPFIGRDAKRANSNGVRGAIEHLRQGGMLGTFPSGVVSHFSLSRRNVADSAWSKHVPRLVRKTGAAVVPMYFEGRNSLLFQSAGLINRRLRTLLLPRELVNKSDHEVRVRVGKPIPSQKLERYPDDRDAADYLRFKTYLLGGDKNETKALRKPTTLTLGSLEKDVEIAEPVPAETLAEEIKALDPARLMVAQREFEVYCAPGSEMPRVIEEIGRLREVTFREVGEGTGRPRDLDRFDDYYQHLFMWNRETREIVGAYRIALIDEVVAEHGIEGLYTSTLFRFRKRLVEKLDGAMELGRSFVVSKYQRKQASLAVMWRGIGEFICRNPGVYKLVGAVSISNDYLSISKDLMVTFLRAKKFDKELAELISAKCPPKNRTLHRIDRQVLEDVVDNIEEVSALISELERDQKGVPILLRHYLKLNGKLLSFHQDATFSNTIAGFIMVDLGTTDPRLILRFMGKEQGAAFLARHGA